MVTVLCGAGPTQDERGKSGNMEFSILGVSVVVVISKNIYDVLGHRDGSVQKVFAKQAEGLGSPETMWKPGRNGSCLEGARGLSANANKTS